MERIIHHQLVKALSNHNLFSDCQYSFFHKYSTVSLLLYAVHSWSNLNHVFQWTKTYVASMTQFHK